jgi:hypothetical protein
MAGVLASGTLYVDRIEAGVKQGLTKWEGLAKLEIKPNSELKEMLSKDKNKYGQIVASVAINKPAELSLELNDMTREALAIALQGTGAAYSQGSGSITDEVVTAKLGKFVELSKRNIAVAGFVVTNSAGTVTYVLNTDYTVNYALGLLEILSTGAITEAQSLKVDFTYSAVAGDRIQGATLAQVKAELLLDGVNLEDGKPMSVRIYEATLTADGAVDFMGDDFVKLSMKGRMTTPTGKSEPFEVIYKQTYS